MSISKIDKFISRRCDKVIKTKKSNYYKFGDHVLRVSNHIGANSSGSFSIIVDKKDNYMLHSHTSGIITTISYDQVKDFIKGMAIHEDLSIKSSQNENNWAIKETEQLSLIEENRALKAEIAELKKANGHLGNIIGGYRMNAKKAIDKAVEREVARRTEPIRKIVLK